MNERRRSRQRRLLLAVTVTTGAAGLVVACSSSDGTSDPEGPHGVVAQEAGGYDGPVGFGDGGFYDTGAGYDGNLGPDGFGGVAPGDAAYDAPKDGSGDAGDSG